MAIKQYAKGQNTPLSANFESKEFDCHGDGCCSITLIDEKLVQYLQQIRNHFKKPIIVSSAYRCISHNKNIGGVTNSRHSKGQAADIYINGVTPKEIAQYAESIGILGIGLYETNSDGFFVHIDTRTTKSFWYGQKQAPRTTFGGYVAPVVNKQEEETEEMTQEKFNQMMDNWIAEQASKDPAAWSAEARAWAEGAGLVAGNEKGQKMYKKPLTREELVTVLYRALHRYFV